MTDYSNEIAMLTAAKNALEGAKFSLLGKNHRLSAGYITAIIRLVDEAIKDLKVWMLTK